MTANPHHGPNRPLRGRKPAGESRLAWAAVLCACVLAGCGGGEQPVGSTKGSGHAMRSLPPDSSMSRATGTAAAVRRSYRATGSTSDSQPSTPSLDSGDAPRDLDPGWTQRPSDPQGLAASTLDPPGRSTGPQVSAVAQGQALGGPVDPQHLHGLPNLGNTCFINAALQVLTHFPGLRAQALIAVDPPQMSLLRAALQGFFEAYDGHDAQAVNDALAAVVEQLGQLHGFPGIDEIGSLLDLWGNAPTAHPHPGLGLPTTAVVSLNDLEAAYQTDLRVFSMAVQQVGSVQTHGPVDYQWLPHPEHLAALVYNTGNHYIAYLRGAGQWWRLSDSQVQAVSVEHLQQLPIANGQGFELAVYGDEALNQPVAGPQGVDAEPRSARHPRSGEQQAAMPSPATEADPRLEVAPHTPPQFLNRKTRREEATRASTSPARESRVDPSRFPDSLVDRVRRRLDFGQAGQQTTQQTTPSSTEPGVPSDIGPSGFQFSRIDPDGTHLPFGRVDHQATPSSSQPEVPSGVDSSGYRLRYRRPDGRTVDVVPVVVESPRVRPYTDYTGAYVIHEIHDPHAGSTAASSSAASDAGNLSDPD